jgi:geranylgeranylglycerol-phosphate geranylgeranyltransferase
LAFVVAFLFTGAGNSLNDYFDQDIDKVNHPLRPLPSGRIAPRSALVMASVLFAASVCLAFFINMLAFIIVLANLVVMLSYEIFFKAKGAAGNFTISWLTGTAFLFGGSTVMAIEKTYVLAVLAFLATLGREIAKDIEDIKGDLGRYTLPMKLGVDDAGILAALAIVAALLLSPVPLMLGLFSGLGYTYYIPLILATDAIFIYCILILITGKFNASAPLKGGMLMALLAFLIGVILSG